MRAKKPHSYLKRCPCGSLDWRYDYEWERKGRYVCRGCGRVTAQRVEKGGARSK